MKRTTITIITFVALIITIITVTIITIPPAAGSLQNEGCLLEPAGAFVACRFRGWFLGISFFGS